MARSMESSSANPGDEGRYGGGLGDLCAAGSASSNTSWRLTSSSSEGLSEMRTGDLAGGDSVGDRGAADSLLTGFFLGIGLNENYNSEASKYL